MPTLQVITLGCSKNTVDTEHLLFQVRHAYELVPESESRPVDVLLVNTCGFIGDAKEQSVQTILAGRERKKAGEVGRLLVFGCLSQRYKDELPALIPEVDGWFGARDLDPLVRPWAAAIQAESTAGSSRREAALCLFQDFRRLQPPLLLLRHSVYPRRPSFRTHGRAGGRS